MLSRWSSWGAIPQVFDETNQAWEDEREQLRALLTEEEYAAARRTTINAHYTDPAYVAAIWRAVADLGFDGGEVLEPGSGSGTFIGLAPPGARMTGVELDATTAAIARGLYPQAHIRTESFAQTRLPRAQFDLTIGNVPFADVALHDPAYNAAGHSLHNHFILKSLALTRPGGLVAVLTSSFTMDAVNPAARREMNELADLVGAVRLPSGSHRRTAGTEAVMDLVILRRREPGRPRQDTAWEKVSARAVDGHTIRLNTYFEINPDHILGDLHVGTGMYGNQTLHVRTEDLAATPQRFAEALSGILRDAQRDGLLYTPATAESRQERLTTAQRHTSLWDGTIVAAEDGQGFQIAKAGALHDLPVPAAQSVELRALLELRDRARALLEAEATALEDDDDLTPVRERLRQDYERYVQRYGAINRYTLRRTGRYAPVLDEDGTPILDPETGAPVPGEEIMARMAPRVMLTLRQDPYNALVKALERFDETEQTSAPAALLRQRMVAPRPARQGAETPAEALAIALNESGRVRLDRVADLLGLEPAEARAQLGDLVYDDPDQPDPVPAPEYLSGDVRTKLDRAREAARTDERYLANVAALDAVQPDPIGAGEIEARLGAVWISATIHQQFLAEILQDNRVRVENPLPGTWHVTGGSRGVRATNEWGTERRPAPDIAQAVMEQRRIEVTDTVDRPDGGTRQVLNPVETTAAQEKADALQQRFAAWVWEDPARAAELAEVYNRRFNSIRLRDYSQAGEYLTLPGLAASLTLRPHQRSAVARMIAEPAVGLFHEVGAGKTLEMIVGAQEMRRMGLISKPAVVVPNHMLEQFSREWLQAYPQARVLVASSEDLKGDKRRLFIARAAANDWDAIVMTQSAFKRIGISPEFQTRYIDQQLAQARAALEDARGNDGRSVKRIERRVLALEERHKKSLDTPRDPGLSFEETGIDYLIVDEAHMFKNLATISNITDAAIEGSQQATDLHIKLEYLRQEYGEKVATMATATPLANSITEAYVMQRYLRPDLLENAGVTSFDGWAATFGSQVTEMEMGPAGGFRLKTRFARFQNVPEMLRMWHVFADVKTSEDLNLPVPLIAPRASDGQRAVETVVLDPTPELADYITAIGQRADKVSARRVTPDQDNMLKISTDGRKAALDMRLVDQHAHPTGPTKLDAVAARILEHWRATSQNVYRDDVTGQDSPVPGGLQLVFSDLGTPNDRRWDAYNELRTQLIQGGMPPDAVRFIHEARNDSEKGRMFAAARAGHIAVLIGSTTKMGMGTNVQARLTALHDVDCPWRPADLEQRHGRGIRQGNQNSEVALYRYVVEGSFDAYSWQTVGRKATFIAQIMRGRLDSREIEDIGDTALSASEAKALASGNPLVLEKANADSALQKLRRQETAHHRSQSALEHTRRQASDTIQARELEISELQVAITRTRDVAGDAFTMTVDGQPYRHRTDAAAAIARTATRHAVARATTREPVHLGDLAGHRVMLTIETRWHDQRIQPIAILTLDQTPGTETPWRLPDITDPNLGVIRTLENRVLGLPRRLTLAQADLAGAHRDLEDSQARLGAPFPYADQLTAARERVAAVDAALTAHEDKTPAPTPQPATNLSTLRSRLDSIDADHDVPPPTPPTPAVQNDTVRRSARPKL